MKNKFNFDKELKKEQKRLSDKISECESNEPETCDYCLANFAKIDGIEFEREKFKEFIEWCRKQDHLEL